jgi:cysteinyl-tRNA synthetase
VPAASVVASEYTERFQEVMDDDFNTPEAIAVLQRLTREINLAKDTGKERKAAALSAELRSLAGVLGILALEPEQWFRLAKPAMPGTKNYRLVGEPGEFTITGGSADLAGAESGDAGVAAGAAAGAPVGDGEVQQLVDARIAARKAKDFAESDRIRDLLAAAGVIVEDKPGGRSTWRRA